MNKLGTSTGKAGRVNEQEENLSRKNWNYKKTSPLEILGKICNTDFKKFFYRVVNTLNTSGWKICDLTERSPGWKNRAEYTQTHHSQTADTQRSRETRSATLRDKDETHSTVPRQWGRRMTQRCHQSTERKRGGIKPDSTQGRCVSKVKAKQGCVSWTKVENSQPEMWIHTGWRCGPTQGNAEHQRDGNKGIHELRLSFLWSP